VRNNEIVSYSLRLFIITFSVALILAVGNHITADRIEQLTIQLQNDARKSVLPEAADFDEVPLEGLGRGEYKLVNSVYEGKNEGATVGYCVNVVPKGFGGAIDIMVGVDIKGKITGIKIISSSETAGLGSKAERPEFLQQYIGKSTANTLKVIKNATPKDDEIEAISGATVTSNAVTDGVNAAAQLVNEKILKVKGE